MSSPSSSGIPSNSAKSWWGHAFWGQSNVRFGDHNRFKTARWWITKKREEDGLGGGDVWRVGDRVYDLSRFAKRHPGGETWIRATRGTDITELFESSHLNIRKARRMLQQYAIARSKRKSPLPPRSSPYTFDGFYADIRDRAFKILGSDVSPKSDMLAVSDCLLSFWFVLWTGSLFATTTSLGRALAVAAGLVLAHVCGCAHNFFHKRDNWRMYAFDLSLLSSYEWRISHCISHHCFPNSIADAEVLGLEPVFVFLPMSVSEADGRKGEHMTTPRHKKKRSILLMFFYFVISLPVNALIFHFSFIARAREWMRGETCPRPENALVFLELLAGYFALSPFEALIRWSAMHCTASVWFLTTSLVAGTHHHPEMCWHDGDGPPAGGCCDFGKAQLAATVDRSDVNGAGLLVRSTMFGDHALHHLFPTVDHSRLGLLAEALVRGGTFGTLSKRRERTTLECAKGFYQWVRLGWE